MVVKCLPKVFVWGVYSSAKVKSWLKHIQWCKRQRLSQEKCTEMNNMRQRVLSLTGIVQRYLKQYDEFTYQEECFPNECVPGTEQEQQFKKKKKKKKIDFFFSYDMEVLADGWELSGKQKERGKIPIKLLQTFSAMLSKHVHIQYIALKCARMFECQCRKESFLRVLISCRFVVSISFILTAPEVLQRPELSYTCVYMHNYGKKKRINDHHLK